MQLASVASRADLINEVELRRQSQAFLGFYARAVESGALDDTTSPAWAGMPRTAPGDFTVARAPGLLSR